MNPEIIAYARTLADEIRTAGVRNVTTKASAAVPPCVLVVPIPARVYDIAHGYTATWTVVAMAPAPGDERAAEQLDDMVNRIATVIPLESADPSAWQIPGADSPVPAYVCKYTTEVENHP